MSRNTSMNVGIEQLHFSERRQNRQLPIVLPGFIDQTRKIGQVLPVVVRSSGVRRYEILANAESWIAVMKAGLRQVRIELRDDLSEEKSLDMINSQREPDPITESESFEDLLGGVGRRQHGDITKLADQLGVSRSYIAHSLRLLNLPEQVQRAVRDGALCVGHAKALLGLSTSEQQIRFASLAISEHWSVHRTREEMAKTSIEPIQVAAAVTVNAETKKPWIAKLERDLTDLIGSTTELDEEAGQLIIDYHRNNDILEGILNRLGYSSD